MENRLGYRVNDQVVASSFDDGEGVVIDLRARRYYVFNETAIRVLEAVRDQMSLDQLIESLLDRYDVSPERALLGVEESLKTMASLGFISPSK